MPTRIVVVDPNPVRRGDYARALAAHEVRAVAELDPAAPLEAEVVVLSLTQAEGHGLELGRSLKQTNPRLYVLVYGRPAPGSRLGPSAATAFAVDRLLSPPPEPADLVVLVEAHLQSLRRAKRVVAGAPAPRAMTWGELFRAPFNVATMRAILTKDLRSA